MEGEPLAWSGEEGGEIPNWGGQVSACASLWGLPALPSSQCESWGGTAPIGSVGKGTEPACSLGTPQGWRAGPSLGSEPCALNLMFWAGQAHSGISPTPTPEGVGNRKLGFSFQLSSVPFEPASLSAKSESLGLKQ